MSGIRNLKRTPQHAGPGLSVQTPAYRLEIWRIESSLGFGHLDD